MPERMRHTPSDVTIGTDTLRLHKYLSPQLLEALRVSSVQGLVIQYKDSPEAEVAYFEGRSHQVLAKQIATLGNVVFAIGFNLEPNDAGGVASILYGPFYIDQGDFSELGTRTLAEANVHEQTTAFSAVIRSIDMTLMQADEIPILWQENVLSPVAYPHVIYKPREMKFKNV